MNARPNFIPGLGHVARDMGTAADEKMLAAACGSVDAPAPRLTSFDIALSGLVNCTIKTPQQLHDLTVELARIASRFMYDSTVTYDRIDEVVDMLDTASDIAEGLKERDTTCTSCTGNGEGRSDAQSCGGCGGKGWKA